MNFNFSSKGNQNYQIHQMNLSIFQESLANLTKEARITIRNKNKKKKKKDR